jgi:hypothetical protein
MKTGIGNVAMGGTFKSIYLAQGRKNANSKTFGKNYILSIPFRKLTTERYPQRTTLSQGATRGVT